MVRFIEGDGNGSDGKDSKWHSLMESTKEKFREIWGNSGQLPDRE